MARIFCRLYIWAGQNLTQVADEKLVVDQRPEKTMRGKTEIVVHQLLTCRVMRTCSVL